MFGFVPTSSFSPYAADGGYYSSPPPRRSAPTAYSPFGGFIPGQAPTPSYDLFGLSGYDDYPTASLSYDPYAARRAALERQALIEEQQRQQQAAAAAAAALEEQRRQAILRRRQQQLQEQAEEEYYRRQMALRQAIEEEERERYRAAVKAAKEEERRRREAVARRQEEILRRQREEEERAKRAREQQQQAEEGDDEEADDDDEVYAGQEEFVNPFFSWLYPHAFARQQAQQARQQAQRPRPSRRESHQAKAQQQQQQQQQPAPVVESVRSVSPTPNADRASVTGPTVEDVTTTADEAEEVAPAPVPVPTTAHTATATATTATTATTASSSRPATPQPSAEQMEAAARAVQSAWKHHHQRQQQLTKLATLSAELDAKRDEFGTLPSQLDFLPPAATAGESAQPKLAFTKTNVPIRAYEDALLRLLTKVDEVQSGGDREVKKARKGLVGEIEAELARLDAHRERLAQEWKDANPGVVAGEADAAGSATANAADAVADLRLNEDAEMTDEHEHEHEQEEGGVAESDIASTASVDSIDAKVAMMEDLLTAPKGHKLMRDGRAHSQKKRQQRKSRKHREGARGVDRV